MEVGGEFVGPTQNHVIALADELGVRRFPAYSDTLQSAYIADGKVTLFKGDVPPDPDLADLAAFRQIAGTAGSLRARELGTRLARDAAAPAPSTRLAWRGQHPGHRRHRGGRGSLYLGARTPET